MKRVKSLKQTALDRAAFVSGDSPKADCEISSGRALAASLAGLRINSDDTIESVARTIEAATVTIHLVPAKPWPSRSHVSRPGIANEGTRPRQRAIQATASAKALELPQIGR